MGGPGRVDGADRDEFSNFLPAPITAQDGTVYASVEHYFQAHKTRDAAARRAMASAPFERIYALGRSVELRPDWEGVKLKVMLRGCRLKYDQHPALRRALLATTGAMTFEPSAGFWGVAAGGGGENWNGKIHGLLRSLYRGDVDGCNAAAWALELRCAALAPPTRAALLVIDPQRAFATGAWARHFGDVARIREAFGRLAALDFDALPPVLVTRCPYPPPDVDVDGALGHAPFLVKPGMDATCDPRLECFLDAWRVETLIVAGCTTTSCVRVSSRAIKRRRPTLDVVVDLRLCAAREANHAKNADEDPVLVDIYGREGCVGRSALDLAVAQMRGDGVRVVDGVDYTEFS